MATNRSGQTSVAIPRHAALSRIRLLFTLALLAFLAVCLAFSWSTRNAMAHLPFLDGRGKAGGLADSKNTLVDLHPWQTAQTLTALAVTAEEVEFAREAERLADHEVDQAFASALRLASAQRHELTGEALTLSQKLTQFQQLVEEDEARLQSLTSAAGVPTNSARRAAPHTIPTDDIDIAKAQLGLDSDELADARQDLARVSGDERATIQQELAAHESSMRKYDGQSRNQSEIAIVSTQQYGTLVGRLKAWFEQRTRDQLIQQARQQAQADAAALTGQHDQLERQADTASSVISRNSSQPAANPSSGTALDGASKLANLKDRSAQRQLLSIYDDRIQSQRQLAVVYGNWSAQVLLQHRIVLHLILQSVALIAFILICVILFDALVRHLVDGPTLDRPRIQTLRIIFKLGVQIVGVVLILIVIFGAPSQMPTILGLTTAGLTVVLQDFIIAFFGWFVLMGKNGIRAGDWVEINGVSGEVVEIGIWRTAILETGNWTDKGHPTGRRATFVNSFAIKGQFFNFSTSGQWMWDEIRVSIPAGEDSYALIELIHKAVLKQTEKDGQLAEEEWKRDIRNKRPNHFTAAPAVDMRPGVSGIDIIARYVTRASDRFEVRNRLYESVIELLHKPLTLKVNLTSGDLLSLHKISR